MNRLIRRLKSRLLPFFDLSAWVLVLVALVPLFFIDPAMAQALVQWTLFGLALAGVSVVISRVTLPQIKLSELLSDVQGSSSRSLGSALVVIGLMLYLALIFLGLVLWAKA